MSSPRKSLKELASRIRALVLDVDGVLTDATLFYGPAGEALKRFSARDGFAIKMAQAEGIAVAILSGRVAPPLRARLKDLGIPRGLVIQGSRDKAHDLDALAERLGLSVGQLAYVGDDLPDLAALLRVGLAACPADAAPEVRRRCHFVCGSPGGQGAVREVVELLLGSRGRWDDLVHSWERGRAKAILDRSSRKGAKRGDNS